MQNPTLNQIIPPTQLLHGLTARVGKHGCSVAWHELANSDAARFAFLSQEPSESRGAMSKNGRLVLLQSLHRDGLGLEWVAADEQAVDIRGRALVGADRWVLRTAAIDTSVASRSKSGGYFGCLPFGLEWNTDFAQAQMLLGVDHTGAPTVKQKAVTFFIADARSVEILYDASLRAIVRIDVSFLGATVPWA